MQSSSSVPNNQEIVILRLLALKNDTTSAETVDSNRTAKISQTKPAPHLEIPVVVPAPTLAHNQNQVSGILEDSDSDLSYVPTSNKDNVREQGASQQYICIGANLINYKNDFQKNKATTTKTNLSIPTVCPHCEASCILCDYALSHPKKYSTRGFVQIAQKIAKASTPDMSSLKDAPKSHDVNA